MLKPDEQRIVDVYGGLRGSRCFPCTDVETYEMMQHVTSGMTFGRNTRTSGSYSAPSPLSFMSRRQRSMDASYEPLPQQNETTVTNSISVAAIDDETQPSSNIPITGTKLDGRIRWIHFILGSAVLLPWNGT